jgi:hypothetical protein
MCERAGCSDHAGEQSSRGVRRDGLFRPHNHVDDVWWRKWEGSEALAAKAELASP